MQNEWERKGISLYNDQSSHLSLDLSQFILEDANDYYCNLEQSLSIFLLLHLLTTLQINTYFNKKINILTVAGILDDPSWDMDAARFLSSLCCPPGMTVHWPGPQKELK